MPGRRDSADQRLQPQVSNHVSATEIRPPPQTFIPGATSETIRYDTKPHAFGSNEPRETREPRVPPSSSARWNPVGTTPAPQEMRPIASTADSQQSGITQAQATMQVPAVTAPPVPRRPLPTLRYVNSPFVLLEYELSKVGPSGVGRVWIYYTENDGQTWELLAKDRSVVGKTSGGRHQGEIQLPQDGIYGFTLVVKSKAQLKQDGIEEGDDATPGATRADSSSERPGYGPKPGDVPEIRVEVDAAAPEAELFLPRRDTTKSNALVLLWKASDKNLSSNPITLEWSEHREGPWNPIASNLPNTGKHSWQLPDRLPVEVYLRCRVVDLAGNEGIATTPHPITVDLSDPEVRLTNVSVSPRR